MLLHLMLSQRSLKLSSFLFILFSLFYSPLVISTIVSSNSLMHYTASIILLLVSSRVFLISVIVLSIVHCLLFNYPRSLLNIFFCIFLICASSLFICSSILFSRLWIIFTNIALNSFAGRLLFPLHLFGLVGFTMFLHLLHISVFTFCFIYCVYVSILQVKGHNSC